MFSTGGAYAFNVVSGDFNADGIPDLAVANSSSGTIGILLGKGDGSFLPVATFSSGGKLPTTIAVADFNHDGKLDLAVTNQFDNTVSILLGNGSGGFSAPTTFSPGGTGVYGLAVGDFDGNGNLDIAVTNWSTNGAVDLLMGDGAGGFSPGGEFSSGGSHPSTIVAGDFNNDGKLDLAFTNDNSYTVGIIFGDAKGSFSAPLTVNSGPGAPYCLTQGDFNRDGALDLVVANNLGTGFAANNYGSGLAVLLGDGSGGFSAAKAFDAGGIGAHAVAVGDFNGDGCSDVAVANDSSNTVGVLLNVYDRSIVTLTSPHGLPFDIAVGPFGEGELIQGYENAFDGDGRLMVGGTAFQPDTSTCSMADTGRTVVTANGTVAGLMVNREVTVPNTGSEDFARTVDTFTNSTGTPITTTVTIVGNLGSDAATRVFATSDGDTVVEATDQWIGTDDASDGSGTPAIIHYIYGPQGLQPASVSVIGDNIVWTYNVTISTGQTLQLAWFTILGTTEAAAVAAANALVTPAGFGGQASAFLDATELASLANFGWDTTPLTVTINQASGQAGVTDSAPIHFTAVFSEPVNDFTTGDVTLAGTAGATTAIVTNPSGDLMTYDVAVSNMARDGSVTVGIATGVAHDLAGNPNAASTSTINTVNYSAPRSRSRRMRMRSMQTTE